MTFPAPPQCFSSCYSCLVVVFSHRNLSAVFEFRFFEYGLCLRCLRKTSKFVNDLGRPSLFSTLLFPPLLFRPRVLSLCPGCVLHVRRCTFVMLSRSLRGFFQLSLLTRRSSTVRRFASLIFSLLFFSELIVRVAYSRCCSRREEQRHAADGRMLPPSFRVLRLSYVAGLF